MATKLRTDGYGNPDSPFRKRFRIFCINPKKTETVLLADDPSDVMSRGSTTFVINENSGTVFTLGQAMKWMDRVEAEENRKKYAYQRNVWEMRVYLGDQE